MMARGDAQLEAPTETCESTTLSTLNVLSAVASGTGNSAPGGQAARDQH